MILAVGITAWLRIHFTSCLVLAAAIVLSVTADSWLFVTNWGKGLYHRGHWGFTEDTGGSRDNLDSFFLCSLFLCAPCGKELDYSTRGKMVPNYIEYLIP